MKLTPNAIKYGYAGGVAALALIVVGTAVILKGNDKLAATSSLAAEGCRVVGFPDPGDVIAHTLSPQTVSMKIYNTSNVKCRGLTATATVLYDQPAVWLQSSSADIGTIKPGESAVFTLSLAATDQTPNSHLFWTQLQVFQNGQQVNTGSGGGTFVFQNQNQTPGYYNLTVNESREPGIPQVLGRIWAWDPAHKLLGDLYCPASCRVQVPAGQTAEINVHMAQYGMTRFGVDSSANCPLQPSLHNSVDASCIVAVNSDTIVDIKLGTSWTGIRQTEGGSGGGGGGSGGVSGGIPVQLDISSPTPNQHLTNPTFTIYATANQRATIELDVNDQFIKRCNNATYCSAGYATSRLPSGTTSTITAKAAGADDASVTVYR